MRREIRAYQNFTKFIYFLTYWYFYSKKRNFWTTLFTFNIMRINWLIICFHLQYRGQIVRPKRERGWWGNDYIDRIKLITNNFAIRAQHKTNFDQSGNMVTQADTPFTLLLMDFGCCCCIYYYDYHWTERAVLYSRGIYGDCVECSLFKRLAIGCAPV